MTDFLLLDQVHKQMAEIPKPRLLFRKGMMVRGFFRPYLSFADYTKASIFSSLDEITPVTVRISAMFGDQGTADTIRNIKGMFTKFHSREGNCDLICQSLPVFFLNRPEEFTEFHQSFSRRRSFDGINSHWFWKMVVAHPEAINSALRFFSHQGIAGSYTEIMYYSMDTHIWVNQEGEGFLLRCRWMPILEQRPFSDVGVGGRREMDRVSAEFLAGFDPDTGLKQLERSLEEGYFPSYELQVQMTEYKYISHPNYLKRTLCWNDAIHPPVSVGMMKLTELVSCEEQEMDRISFAPGNLIPGIGICEDEASQMMDCFYRLSARERGGIL